MRRTAKVAAAHLLYYTGVLRVWQAFALRGKAVVLMYHRVLTAEERHRTGSHPGIVIDQATFAGQMALLKERFKVLSIEEFADRMDRHTPFDSSSCLITFDDGWLDNFTQALPVLRRHQLPALVFLPVHFIGQQRMFWREALTHLVVEAVRVAGSDAVRRQALHRILAPSELAGILDEPAADVRPSVVRAIASRPQLRVADAESLMSMLTAEFDITVESLNTPDRFVDWSQVREMAQDRISFGGHGAEHRLLAELTPAEAADEVNESKRVVDRDAARAVPAFSYPNGSFSPQVAAAVRDAGYRLAFTTKPGFVRVGDDPFAVKRINIHEDMTNTPAMFLARLVGLF